MSGIVAIQENAFLTEPQAMPPSHFVQTFLLFIITMFGIGAALGAEEPGVTVELQRGGYLLSLNRTATDALNIFLHDNVDEASLAGFLAKLTKKREVTWELKVMAGIVVADVILFKRKVSENAGRSGVAIRVYGKSVEDMSVSTIPVSVYTGVWKLLLPEKWRARIEASETLPLFWTIRPVN